MRVGNCCRVRGLCSTRCMRLRIRYEVQDASGKLLQSAGTLQHEVYALTN